MSDKKEVIKDEVIKDEAVALEVAVKPKAKPKAKVKPDSIGKIINKSKNKLSFCGVDIVVGGEYELTLNDLKNELLLAKLGRADELNMVDWIK